MIGLGPGGCPERPSLVATLEIAGPIEPQVSQGSCSKARGIALGADHDHLLMAIADRREPVRRVGVEAPFEYVSFDDEGTWERTFRRALLSRPDVDHDSAASDDLGELARGDPIYPHARRVQ